VANVHTVAPGVLVRGGQPDAAGFRALQQQYGIHTVVNLNDATATSEAKVVEGLGMRYVALPSNPFRPDSTKVLAFLQTVASASADGGAVYVHCRQGMDRTGFAVAAYRILSEGWDADRAMTELRSYQAFPHALLFPGIGPFVRGVYRDRESWLRRLTPPAATPPAPAAPHAGAVAASDRTPG
jgi:protein tyrosine/serine phosphatase